MFMPEFQCNVYDHVLGGLSKRILGIILIDIKQIIKGTQKQYQDERDEALKVKLKLNSENNKENGMLEINTNENIISTSSNEQKNIINSNDNNNSLDLSNELNSPLINDSINEPNFINKKDYSRKNR